MKLKKTLNFVIISISMLAGLSLVSCSTKTETKTPTEPEVTPTQNVINEKFTITFVSNEQTIYTTEATPGDFVTIPDESSLSGDPKYNDPNYYFGGWTGVDEIDLAAGKVEVFYENATYQAIWRHKFGTDNVFKINEVPTGKTIVADGVKDEAYSSTEAITINTVTSGETDTTATMYAMFNDDFIYIFAEVNDSTVFTRDYEYKGSQWVEHNDSFEFWIDLLHNDSLISNGWNGGWGGPYRGEPGPMCEAHFKLNAGYDPEVHGRFGLGSEAIWDGWWSNACNTDNVSFGISKVTETGYTVEYQISLKDTHIPDYLRLNDEQQIGIGVKIYDKKEAGGNKASAAANSICLESINHDMNSSGPRSLSTFIVNKNND